MMHTLSRALLCATALAASLAGSAGCGSPDAFLEVTVPIDPALKIDQVRFTFTAPDAAPKILTAPDPAQDFTESPVSVGVILPPEFADVELTVAAEAFAGGAADGVLVGEGSGKVTTARGVLAKLTVDLVLAFTCGDGVIESVEECDDGNTAAGDGCAASCTVEPTYTCSGEPSVCVLCGDGSIDGTEACDDGNGAAGDGCDATCAVEAGFECAGVPSACAPVCGDGFVRGDEACDDAGVVEGDGCDAACAVENGWTCDGADPTVCTPVCGDGVILGGEACDDDGVLDGDGCSAACLVETGWACAGEPSACTEGCGDGDIVGAEACDDGALVGGDGCSAACAIENGYTCTGEPSVCATACGDGVVAGAEACDDNDTANGDGCDNACSIEPGWDCTGDPSVCAPICGDGTVISGLEACDDNNGNQGDGCDGACVVETGFDCAGTPSICAATCGDGVVVGAETQAGGCDDGNAAPGDGCDNCVEEPGFDCTGQPSVCATVCGDGIQAGLEECDEGNANGDLSGALCRTDCTLPFCGDGIEDPAFGEQCDEVSPACLAGCRDAACGDGLILGAEACDDGNNAPGDGCSAACDAIEVGFQCGGVPSRCGLAADVHLVPGDFATLTAAVGNGGVNNGDILIVTANLTDSPDVTKSLIIVGTGQVVTDSVNNGGVIASSSANVEIQGLTIRNTANNANARGIDLTAGTLTLTDVTVDDTGGVGVDQRAAGTTLNVRRSLIANAPGGGISVQGPFTVENTVLRDNAVRGIVFNAGATGTFRFNTVTGNAVGLSCNNAATRTVVTSSIVFGNTTNVQSAANCDTATSLLTDPGFVSATDHRLTAGSPAIDAAGADCTTEDFDNEPRPFGPACDIGADEFIPEPG